MSIRLATLSSQLCTVQLLFPLLAGIDISRERSDILHPTLKGGGLSVSELSPSSLSLVHPGDDRLRRRSAWRRRREPKQTSCSRRNLADHPDGSVKRSTSSFRRSSS